MVEMPCDITDPLGLRMRLAALLSSEVKRWRSRMALEYKGNVMPAATSRRS